MQHYCYIFEKLNSFFYQDATTDSFGSSIPLSISSNRTDKNYCLPELALGRPRITDRPCVSVCLVSVVCLSVLTGIELNN